ncbi:hypothetical protein D3C72_1558890 [compost metagenome]
MSIWARLAISPNCRQLASASSAHHATRRPHRRRPRSQVSHSVASAASSEGSRNASGQLPSSWWLAACIHMNTGGFSAYSSLPRCGSSHCPLSTMARAASTKRGSSGGEGWRRPKPANRASTMAMQASIRQRWRLITASGTSTPSAKPPLSPRQRGKSVGTASLRPDSDMDAATMRRSAHESLPCGSWS